MSLPLFTFDKWNSLNEEMEIFYQKIDEIIKKEYEQIKASKMKIELCSKLAQETKVNEELIHQLAQLKMRCAELDRVCKGFESLTIADSDKNRLENAKALYQLVKELTGVRLYFSAPPNIAKGYVKNETQRLLQPFEFDAKDSDALWDVIRSTSSTDWPMAMDKENMDSN